MRDFNTIPGFEGLYSIDRLGNVYSHRRDRLLKAKTDKDGYKSVALTSNGKTKYFRVHRLVAITYIPNPNNYPYINHKDENKANNSLNNLEWCTAKYNNNYGSRNSKMSQTKQTKPVLQLDEQGNVIAQYRGVKEAMLRTGINRNSIREVILGNRKTAGGFVWKYI